MRLLRLLSLSLLRKENLIFQEQTADIFRRVFWLGSSARRTLSLPMPLDTEPRLEY